MPSRRLASWLSFLTLALCAPAATAAGDGNARVQQTQDEIQAAATAADAAIRRGPTAIAIGGQASLELPAGFGFIPAAPAQRLLKAMGNRPGDDLTGLIVADGRDANWFMVVHYIAAGYIKDEDAKDWNADELLTNIRTGADETNRERRERGLPELEVIGWVEPPNYQAESHRLVWSVSSRHKGSAGEDGSVNYNTLMLGREGYVSMNLVASLKSIEGLKPTARQLLAALDFNDGKRYADFNATTDKVAEYGLAALVAGVAAKKLGLFAVIAAFAIKFAKVIGVAAIAAIAGLSKWRGRKKATDSDSA